MLESGSGRERFSTTVPSKAQPASSMATRDEARRLERIDNEVCKDDDKRKTFVLFFSPSRQKIYSNLCKSRQDRRKSGQSGKIDKRIDASAHEAEETQPKGNLMLWTVFVILLVLWLLGFIGHFGGQLIHLLLVIAVVVLIINLISGRRTL
jgi:hypothetical protein